MAIRSGCVIAWKVIMTVEVAVSNEAGADEKLICVGAATVAAARLSGSR